MDPVLAHCMLAALAETLPFSFLCVCVCVCARALTHTRALLFAFVCCEAKRLRLRNRRRRLGEKKETGKTKSQVPVRVCVRVCSLIVMMRFSAYVFAPYLLVKKPFIQTVLGSYLNIPLCAEPTCSAHVVLALFDLAVQLVTRSISSRSRCGGEGRLERGVGSSRIPAAQGGRLGGLVVKMSAYSVGCTDFKPCQSHTCALEMKHFGGCSARRLMFEDQC